MKVSVKKIILKTLKWTGISIVFILLLLFLIPLLFPGTIAQQVKTFANKSIDGKLDFSKSRLSFFTHFPSLTVSLDDISLTGSAPFKSDTLLNARQVAFGINLKRLIFDNEVKIDEVYVSDALVNVMVNEKGQANYNVYISPENQPKDTTSTGAAIKLERIDFENCHIKYNDRSAKVFVDAHGFNYVGKGGLSEEVFDLETDAEIDSVDFYLDNVPYLEKKRLRADLITRINTKSLSFVLRKNELRVNRLPLEFSGLFTIFKDGYDINITASSNDNSLKDLFSVLPPQYLTWMEKTRIEGRSDLNAKFRGKYRAAQNLQPDLSVNLSIQDGLVEYSDAPVPLSDLKINLAVDMPALDIEKLKVDMQALYFKMGSNDYFSAYLQSEGFSEMAIKSNVKATLDLKTLDAALGIKNIDMRGRLKADFAANGTFSKKDKKFPKTSGGVSLNNGWLKSSYYPNAITDIKFIVDVQNQAGTYQDLKVSLSPASFTFEGNPVYVNALVKNFDDIDYNLQAKGELNIGRIYKVFSREGLDVEGYAKADVSLQGRQSYATTGQYDKLNNKGTIVLKNIKATSELFPKAFLINEGFFRFQQEKMWFEKFTAAYGKSDFAMNGYLLNTINYFLESNGTLSGNFNVKSKLINVDEFMALKEGENTDRKKDVEQAKAQHPKQSGVVVLPTNLNVSLTANANKVEYSGLVLNNLIGKVGIGKGRINLENTTFNIIDCNVGIDAMYDDESATSANFNAHFRAKDFNVKRAYNEIPLFHDLVTAAEKAEGIISIDYKIKGDLNGNMSPIYESMEGGGVISVRDVKVSGLKLFGGIGNETGVDNMKNPDIKDIKITTRIDDNLISIDPFTFKVAGFRPTIKGTTSFNGQLDMRVRLGLPPFGIVGFPIVITGTHENPKVRIFSKTGQEIPPAVYNKKINEVIKKEGKQESRASAKARIKRENRNK